MRAYDGHIFRLDRHLTRLRRSAQSLGLAIGAGSLISKALNSRA